MAGLDQTSQDLFERHTNPQCQMLPFICYEQGFNKCSDFKFNVNGGPTLLRWAGISAFAVASSQHLLQRKSSFSYTYPCSLTYQDFRFTGLYYVALYVNPWEPSALPHSLVGWSTVFSLNGVVSSFAIWHAYVGMKDFFYVVEWPFMSTMPHSKKHANSSSVENSTKKSHFQRIVVGS
ncbi:uncharacterized protein LACBIDRAFT_302547 [Laccaria bicolor S238N-H82]|uniref:Predicted protein n=1 Tax=Laccaria bicolor (strain S238N-H82 / ATCC MYA-4686) TaxID=486041 RepID=B0DHV4_LACBS|nr:uncharacterized protein LACBIDRAFT_302547 [Laccaria bicolor S238N-H82]EDR05795.1 predicted protein [Laccaria bicolor S238N-H82]|eukprot:XP_001883471.1 predicted protein [Laccaria bicolor S238N-H82]